ncbi:MAG: HNH endonuclease [Candidatus Aureabacteria bacterium]|nr:HNH endonuclease [Candidatus Auribacterota bacterium]
MTQNIEKAMQRFDKRYGTNGGYAKFKALLEEGQTLDAIGRTFGFTRQYASLKKIEFGLHPPEKKYQSKEWLDQRYLKDGKTLKEIAVECDVDPGTIYVHLKKFNVALKGVPSGQRHHRWKGGRFVRPDGSIVVTAGKDKGKYLHRLVMEQHLGRSLRRREKVIHLDGNKSNADIGNLKLVTKDQT